jgi:hypothetical protein
MTSLALLGPLYEEEDRIRHQGVGFHSTVVHCPTVSPPKNVYHRIDNDSAPTLPTSRLFKWDIRLDWNYPAKAP